jgi:MFS family permease
MFSKEGTLTLPRHPAVLTLVLAGVHLLAVLDGLAAALALPQIGEELALGAAGRAWVLNATSVTLAGGLLVAGRLGDLIGRRRVFLWGLALLTVGSAVCGAASSAAWLFTGRAVVGLGAAAAYPSALSLTSSLFPDEPWRTRAFTAGAVAGAAGSLGGAMYGGVVTGLLGWRWVFWLTVPVTLVLMVAGHRLVPVDDETRTERRRRPVDASGAILSSLAVGGLVAGIIGLGTASMPVPLGLVVLVGAVGAGVALVLWERRHPDPLLPGAVIGAPRLLGGSAGHAANSALWSVVVFVLAQQLQAAGRSPFEAALAILPASVGILVAGVFVVPRLRRRFGSVRVAVWGLLLSAACTAWLGAAPASPSFVVHLLIPMALLGIGLDLTSVGLAEHTLKDSVPGAEAVSAAVFEASPHVGGAVSIALYAAVLATAGYAPAYLIAAACGLLGAVLVRRFSGAAGAVVGP